MLDDLDFPSYWIKVQERDIHYKCLGNGPPVILLHGSGNDWHEWQKNIAFLAQNFHVYAPDLPGFGLSESPPIPISPSWFAPFLKNFMENCGITTAYLAGHSLGGAVSLAFALDFPERVNKLVLIDSAGLGEMSRKSQLLLFLIRGVKRVFGKGKRLKYIGSREDWLFIDRLHKLKPPLMIIWGERDLYLPVSQAKLAHSLVPDSQLYIFPRCGHAPQKERSEEFNNLVCQFFTR